MDTNAILATKDFEIARQYWMEALAELPPDMDLPAMEGDVADDEVARESFAFGLDLAGKSLSLANNQYVLSLVVLTAILKIVLRKYSRQDDIIVWAPLYSTTGRDYPIDRMLPFKDRLNAAMPIKRWLVEVKRTIIGGYKHQHYSIDNVLAALGHGPRKQALQQVFIQLENIHNEGSADDLIADSGFWCGFSFLIEGGDIAGTITYSRKRFEAPFIRSMARHFLEVARQVVADIEPRIDSIELLPLEEKQALLDRCNGDSAPENLQLTVWDLFLQRAAAAPGSFACGCAEESQDYREVMLRARGLATRLARDFGMRRSDRAAVLCHRSCHLIVAFLGIIGAGCVYVPLDPSFPEKRIRAVLQDAAVNVVVCSKNAGHLPGSEYSLINIDDEGMQYDKNWIDTGAAPQPCDPVYAIYTSGSTGRPKGVLIRHGNLANFTGWRVRSLSYTENDVSLQMLSPAFDAFGSNLYPALCSGGGVVLLPEDHLSDYDRIRRVIRERRVTNLSVLPSMYRLLLDGAGGEDLKTLRFAVLGGEAADAALVSKSARMFPHITLVNEYGPTESCVAATACLDMKNNSIRNIGRPVANNRVIVLDVDDRLLPAGMSGELCVCGESVGLGYLNDGALTREKFAPDSVTSGGRPMYRTGDRARCLDDGSFEYIGRIDGQVKIRGYRVEPSEVEALLLESGLVEAVAVIAAMDASGDRFLCAYWIPARDDGDETQLKRHLEGLCPPYMIPAHFVQLQSFPLTANGKLNKQALPEPVTVKKERFTPPRNLRERELASMWSQLLGIAPEEIGIFDNFFDLGGHSLKVTMLISKILRKFAVKIPLGIIFDQPTIASIAEVIGRSSSTGCKDIQPVEKMDYYPLSSAQSRLFFLQQFNEIGASYNMPFAVRINGQLDTGRVEAVFGSLIERHETLRTAFLAIDSQPVQRVLPAVAFSLQIFDATSPDDRDSKELEAQRIVHRFIAPFRLDQPPLMRMALIRMAGDDAVLLFDIHHIICDGTSGAILGHDFLRLYHGDELAPLDIQYKDYACWQRQLYNSGEIAAQENYWSGVYDPQKKIPTLHLPLDFPRGETMSYQGDRFQFELEPELYQSFQALGRRYNATLYMNLLAAFNVLLHKYTADEDIIVGCAVAGRDREDLQKILGMFINILPMRNFPSGGKSYTAFLQEVGNHVIQAFENQEFPFERLIGNLKSRLDNDPSRHPLYVVDFTLQNFGQAEEYQLDVTVVPFQMENKTSKLDMNLMAYEREDRIRFSLEYCSGLFRRETIEKMAAYLIKIIGIVSGDPDILLKDIQLLEEWEKETVAHTIQKNKSLLAQLAGEDFDELF